MALIWTTHSPYMVLIIPKNWHETDIVHSVKFVNFLTSESKHTVEITKNMPKYRPYMVQTWS